VLSWHAKGGTTDPTALPPGHHLGRTTVVINSAILVLRGLAERSTVANATATM